MGAIEKGIGDYVHLQAQNYLQYGINQIKEGPDSGWESKLSSMTDTKIKYCKELFKLNPYSNFETLLNWVMRPVAGDAAYGDTGFTYEYLKSARDIIYQVYKQDFDTYVPIIQENVANIEGIYMKGVKPPKTTDKTKRVKVSPIVSSLEALQNIINSSSEQTYSKEQMTVLTRLGDKLEKALVDFVNENNYMLGAEGSPKTIKIDKARPFLEILNEAKFYSTGVASGQRGDLGEDFVLATVGVGRHMALDELKKFLEDAIAESKVQGGGKGPIKGNVTSKVQFDPKYFPDGVQDQLGNILGEKHYVFENGMYASRHATKDKVDMSISVPSFDPGAETMAMASIKNSASGNNIKLVDSLSLLMICQNLAARGETYMATHYLNQISLNQKTDAYNTATVFIKLSVLEQAIQGYKGEHKADVLMANFNGSFRVVPIDNILHNVASAIGSIKDAATFSPALESISLAESNIKVSDDPIKGPWLRIAKILAAAHGTKITVHLKHAALG